MKSKPTIGIIGADFSGLVIGLHLRKKGYDVTIFEARERVGERVFTVLYEK